MTFYRYNTCVVCGEIQASIFDWYNHIWTLFFVRLFPFLGKLNALFQHEHATTHTAFRSMELLEYIFGEKLISWRIWRLHSPTSRNWVCSCREQPISTHARITKKGIAEFKRVVQNYMHSSMAETLGKVLGNKVRGVAGRQEQVGKHFSTSCAHWALCVCSILQIPGC